MESKRRLLSFRVVFFIVLYCSKFYLNEKAEKMNQTAFSVEEIGWHKKS